MFKINVWIEKQLEHFEYSLDMIIQIIANKSFSLLLDKQVWNTNPW